MQVITISGKARHGKDSAAEFISDYLTYYHYSSVIVHYADFLKFILKEYYHWDGNKNEEGRHLLQHIGTDIVREKNPDFWVTILDQLISVLFSHVNYIIIPDARFPNEITHWIEKENLAVAIKVIRPEQEIKDQLTEAAKQHESETALDDYPFNYTIEAENLDELRIAISTVMDEVTKC